MRHVQLGLGAAALAAALTLPAGAGAAEPSFDPNDPGKAGYRLVFDEEFNDASAIEPTSAEKSPPGYNFYTRLFPVWGSKSTNHAFSVADGVLTIAGGQLATAAPADTPEGYAGSAFAGGAYFEARIAFDADTVKFDTSAPISDDNWWPSFYAVAAEYFTDKAQWKGQAPGYVRFAEDDFFEAWREKYRYGATMHDWFGPKGCEGHAGGLDYCHVATDGAGGQAPNNVAVRVPGSTDWRSFHTIGNLWVSGARTADHRGLSVFYFDGKPTTARVAWVTDGRETAPPSGESVFNVMDRDHMVVYIGSPATTPLRVDWVHVWQIPGDGAYPAVTPKPGFTGGNGSQAATK